MSISISFDKGTPEGKCPHCNGELLLVSQWPTWKVDNENEDQSLPDEIEDNNTEIIGRWCDNCSEMICICVDNE